LLPYAAGWRKESAGGGQFPAGIDAAPIANVRLRVASARAEFLAIVAMHRDLRRRLREEDIDHVVRQNKPTPRIVPRVLWAVATIAAGAAIVTGQPEWLMATAMFGLVGLLVMPTSWRNVRRMHIRGGVVGLELIDGSTLGYPLASIRGMREVFDGHSMTFSDGVRVWFTRPIADRQLFRSLHRRYCMESLRVDARRAGNAWRRIVLVYMPAFALAHGVVFTTLKVSTRTYVPGSPVLSTLYTSALVYVLFLGPIYAAYWMAVLAVRRRITKMGRKGRAGDASPTFRLVPLVRAGSP